MFLSIYLLRAKNKALSKFIEYKNLIKNNNYNYKIRELYSNNTKEYIYPIKEYYIKLNIIYRYL